MTEIFLDSVLKNDVLPKKVADQLDFDDLEPFFDALWDEFDEVWVQNWRILTALFFGIIVAIAMIGLGVTYCILAPRMKVTPLKKGQDLKLTLFQAVPLVVLIILEVCVLVWYMGADIYLDVKLGHIGDSYNDITYDAEVFINNSIIQVRFDAIKIT